MNLYIKVENDQAVDHPAFEDNLLDAFNGQIPDHWKPFIRIDCPVIGVYEVLESEKPTYKKIDGVWQDVWSLRPMTVEEKTAKQQAVITTFNNREQSENWTAWTLDEATCQMVPPIPRPEPDEDKLSQGIQTFWCGTDNNWKDTPSRPKGSYKFDFINWAWTEIAND